MPSSTGSSTTTRSRARSRRRTRASSSCSAADRIPASPPPERVRAAFDPGRIERAVRSSRSRRSTAGKLREILLDRIDWLGGHRDRASTSRRSDRWRGPRPDRGRRPGTDTFRAPFVVSAVYCRYRTMLHAASGLPLLDLQHEVTELALVDLPGRARRRRIHRHGRPVLLDHAVPVPRSAHALPRPLHAAATAGGRVRSGGSTHPDARSPIARARLAVPRACTPTSCGTCPLREHAATGTRSSRSRRCSRRSRSTTAGPSSSAATTASADTPASGRQARQHLRRPRRTGPLWYDHSTTAPARRTSSSRWSPSSTTAIDDAAALHPRDSSAPSCPHVPQLRDHPGRQRRLPRTR